MLGLPQKLDPARNDMRRLLSLLAALQIVFTLACGSELATEAQPPSPNSLSSGLAALPTDGVQPWESLDSRGFVTGGAEGPRSVSAFPAASEFATGVERFSQGGD